MKLDKNYKPPEGFDPVLNYRNDPVNGEPVVGHARLRGLSGIRGGELGFLVNKRVPILPLRACGELWSMGWDIPTRWAIDASGQCWMDDAHGGSLSPVGAGTLLSEGSADPSVEDRLRAHLGMKPKLPEWVQAARSAGWTPPTDWDESKYE